MTDPHPDAERQLRMLLEHSLATGNYDAALNVIHSIRQLSGTSPEFSFLTQDELLAPLPDISWFCRPLDLSPGRPAKIVGVGGGGKSIAMQSMAIACISGQLLWGQFPIRHGRVVHLDYEMGMYSSLLRYRALAAGHEVPWPDIAAHLKLAPMPRVYMNKPEFETALRAAIQGAELCLIDSLRRAMPGENENDSALTQYIDVITRVSNDTGCTVLLAHHSSPKGPQTGGRDARAAGRGSSAIHDAGGSELLFESEDGKPTVVKHTRAFIGGMKHPQFLLEIQDTNGGKDVPGGGMRVVATLGQDRRGASKESQDDTFAKDVLERIKASPGVSVTGLAKQTGANRARLKSALDRLEGLHLVATHAETSDTGVKFLGYRAV